jgi:hypothetical protein
VQDFLGWLDAEDREHGPEYMQHARGDVAHEDALYMWKRISSRAAAEAARWRHTRTRLGRSS